MAFFISAEQQRRSEKFDTLVESTDTVLRLPETKRALGRLARQLRVINAQAFLPNMRHGQFRTPLQYRKAPYTALMPITNEEAENANYLVAPILNQHPFSWKANSIVHSKPYHMELDVRKVLYSPDTPILTTGGLRENSLARTMAYIRPTQDGRRVTVSRPAEVIRDCVVSESVRGQAKTVAHEHVHSLDVINDGPLYFFDDHGVASEVRAYHVTNAIAERSASWENTNAFAVESLRRRYASSKHPFAYSRELADALEASSDVTF